MFRKGRCQRQSSGLQNISLEVTFWCQSLGDCPSLEPQWNLAEATGFGVHFHRSQRFCHLQQVWLAPSPGLLRGAGRWLSAGFQRLLLLSTEAVSAPTSCEQILITGTMAQRVRSASEHTSYWPVRQSSLRAFSDL